MTAIATRLTLSDVVRARAHGNPDQPAVLDPLVSLSNADWDYWADLVSTAMRAAGVGSSERVCYLGRNRATYPILAAAAARVGAALVSMNWRLSAEELRHVLDDSRPCLIVAEREFHATLTDALANSRVAPKIVWIDGGAGLADLRTWTASVKSAPSAPHHVAAGVDTVGLINYTSGTTGQPKGVVVTTSQLRASVTGPQLVHCDVDTRFLVMSPVFHVAGSVLVAAVAWLGGAIVLVPDADPLEIATAVARFGVTDAMLVPALISAVMKDERIAPQAFSGLRTLSYGASPISQPTLEKMTKWFGDVDFVQGYGLSETVGPICTLTADDHRRGGRILQSAGRPLPGVEVKVVDPQTKVEVAAGEVGEIWIRSDQNCAGYWCRPTATAELFVKGWLRTGDLGRIDEGYVYLCGRLKDLIITGGENVYASEVEAVLARQPGVAECCVVGVPDERWGETIVAAVVAETGCAVDAATLIAACRSRLARYKCPTEIRFVSELPRNATGKVLSRLVRETWFFSD
ncbi:MULTISPECIES: class I adenylate-forming enzyme family protein [unclassified Mycobacterium]|uniref:class I adenylate-forming enzyme family protein n=1 Tax=unclassified Mycobacterium TaxID=2642494 RepID=UPI0029C94DD4|nr:MULTISPECIES: AMP-binding protein [unclassified Mycobacterium]